MPAKLYLVTLELCLKDDHYPKLHDWLLSMNARQTLTSQWAIWTLFPALEMKKQLRQRTRDDDRVMIVEVGSDWASRRAITDLRTVLKREPVRRRTNRNDGRG